ncbi:hypothetical protein A2U01_0051956 [Trifolium medium]|uniref:Uncharacterized protein n=1 Tax=Trifolium medium TaxID=97028 RepID=A0A392R5C7_9FABA|nr:hypothetical protein [Trifolium medium]
MSKANNEEWKAYIVEARRLKAQQGPGAHDKKNGPHAGVIKELSIVL